MDQSKIVDVVGREVLDSRGNPTVLAKVRLHSGAIGVAAVPSGASTGTREAIELRDGDPKRFGGKGVKIAVQNVSNVLKDSVVGLDARDQRGVDEAMIKADGTDDKGRIGANAILSVSLATARAAASDSGTELYEYLGGSGAVTLPVPMVNVVNGGMHADNPMDFQEFMIAPVGASSFSEGLRVVTEVFHSLKAILKSDGMSTNVGDEGGFAPYLGNAVDALELLNRATESAGWRVGEDVAYVLDPASSEFYAGGEYVYAGEDVTRSTNEQVDYLAELVSRFPIVSVEDGMAQNDWDGWRRLTKRLGGSTQLTGDDLFCTNTRYLEEGIEADVANSLLVKVNQVGTLSEAMDAISMAKSAGYANIISHRSGETEDTTIADLAVAVNSGLIKTGSVSRSERTCKYNRLLEIEAQLGDRGKYPGISAFMSES